VNSSKTRLVFSVLIITSIIGAIFIGIGTIALFKGLTSESSIKLFEQSISSSNVGLVILFLGIAFSGYSIKLIIDSVNKDSSEPVDDNDSIEKNVATKNHDKKNKTNHNFNDVKVDQKTTSNLSYDDGLVKLLNQYGADFLNLLQQNRLPGVQDARVIYRSETSEIVRFNHNIHSDCVLKVSYMKCGESRDFLNSDMYRELLGNKFIGQGIIDNCKLFTLRKFVEGLPLSEIIKENNVIKGALLDNVVLSLLKILDLLHSKKPAVVHRDLTPSNVIFKPDTGDIELIDFESSCFEGSSQIPFMTPGFTPKEQMGGNALPSSDLFALASTAYFLGTGRIPIASKNLKSEWFSIVWGIDTYLSEIFGNARILQCLEPDYKARPLSATAILNTPMMPASKIWIEPAKIGELNCGKYGILPLYDR
jgi:serine/threonine protein kinase